MDGRPTRTLNTMGFQSLVLIDADSIAYRAAASKTPEQLHGTIDSIINQCLQHGDFDRTRDGLCIFIEGDAVNNFRCHVAMQQLYKGNRGDKPDWLVPAKEYLIRRWNAECVHGMESEDRLSITAHAFGLDNCLICAIDKDLKQIPGHFYDYNRKKKFSISVEEARLNLYCQILAGDRDDHIPGIDRMGVETARKLLTKTDDPYHVTSAQVYKEKGYTFDYMLQMARLVYLLRNDNDVFHFPPETRELFGSTDADPISEPAPQEADPEPVEPLVVIPASIIHEPVTRDDDPFGLEEVEFTAKPMDEAPF